MRPAFSPHMLPYTDSDSDSPSGSDYVDADSCANSSGQHRQTVSPGRDTGHISAGESEVPAALGGADTKEASDTETERYAGPSEWVMYTHQPSH